MGWILSRLEGFTIAIDLILVMEKRHKEILREKFGAWIQEKKILVLDIPDEYEYMDPELVGILERHWEDMLDSGKKQIIFILLTMNNTLLSAVKSVIEISQQEEGIIINLFRLKTYKKERSF